MASDQSPAPNIVLNDSISEYKLISQSQIFTDETGNVAFEDILKTDKFASYDGNLLNRGFTSDTIWVRLNMSSDLNRFSNWIMEYVTYGHHDVTIFQQDDQLNWNSSKLRRDHGYRFMTRDLSFNTGEQKTIYLKVQARAAMQFSINLRTEKNFVSYVGESYVLLGIYYGFIILAILYHIFLYVSLRDTNNIRFVLACLGGAHFFFAYNGFYHLLLDNTDLAQRLFIVSVSGINFVSTFFIISFISISHYSKFLYELNRWYVISAALIAPLAVFLPYEILVTLCLISVPAGVIIGQITWFKIYFMGNRQAFFVLIAYTPFFLLAGVHTLTISGVLKLEWINLYGSQFGHAANIALLAFGLADRIRRLEFENNLRREKLVRKQQELTFLAAGLAHEINNPLAVVDGYLQQVNRRLTRPNYNFNEAYARIKKSIDRIKTVLRKINLLLSGRGSSYDNVNLYYLFTEAVRELNEEKKLVEIHQNLRFNNKVIPSALIEVIKLISENAVEHSSPSEDHLVEWRRVSSNSVACIDSGSGFGDGKFEEALMPFVNQVSLSSAKGFGIFAANILCEMQNFKLKYERRNDQTYIIIKFEESDLVKLAS